MKPSGPSLAYLFCAVLAPGWIACGKSLSSGQPSDGGVDQRGAGSCPSQGVVIFRMVAPANDVDAGYLYSQSFGDPGDGIWWYSVAKADGTPLQIFLSESTTCESCTGAGVPIGFGCGGLPDAGVTATWSGRTLTGSSTCQPSGATEPGAGKIQCNTSACAPAGQYVVTMCAVRTGQYCGSNNPDAGSSCVSVPFAYPASSDVVGTLPP